VTPCGPSGSAIVAVARFVAGSTLTSIASTMLLRLTTQTAPAPAVR
jgi:hypothetical protein